jgi:hypothetical protein
MTMPEAGPIFRSVDDDAEAYDLCDTCPLGRKLCDEDRRTVEPVGKCPVFAAAREYGLIRYRGTYVQWAVNERFMDRDDARRLTCYMRDLLVEKFGQVDGQ